MNAPSLRDASWIRDVVLTEKMVRAYRLIDICACQYGLCGACQHGEHKRCMLVQGGGVPRVMCETHITNRSGQAIGGSHGAVWRAGAPCRWACPCTSCKAPSVEATMVTPAADQPERQMDLFADLGVAVAHA
jgi:hypothetical protein